MHLPTWNLPKAIAYFYFNEGGIIIYRFQSVNYIFFILIVAYWLRNSWTFDFISTTILVYNNFIFSFKAFVFIVEIFNYDIL